MNARIGSGSDGGNERSPNGESLQIFIEEHKLHVANFHPNTVGKWTRIQETKAGTEQSQIDFILVDESVYGGMVDMVVDECKAYTPYWVTTTKGERKLVFSDHCAMMMTIAAETGPITQSDESSKKIWKVTEAGLQKYKELTMERTLYFSDEDKNSATDMYQLWWNSLDRILSKCFKKKALTKIENFKSPNQGGALVRSALNKIAGKGKIQREVALFYKKRLYEWELLKLEESRVEKLKDTLSQFSEDEKTPPNAYWKILKSVRGKEKTKITSVLKNDGVEVSSEDEIKHEIIEEFRYRLRNRQPADG